MANLFRLMIGALLLLASQQLFGQCGNSVEVVSPVKIKITFDPAQDTFPSTITYEGDDYFLSPTIAPNEFYIDNFLPGGTDLAVEMTLNFDYVSQPCVYGVSGLLDNAAPVNLSFFSGRLFEEDAELYWVTESEVNNAGFEIQQSFDGYYFETIAFIPGNGTTEGSSGYNFEDSGVRNRALNQLVYYRLKQIDYDGKYSYSYIISIDLKLDLDPFEITKITGWNNTEGRIQIYYNSYAGIRKMEVLLVTADGHLVERKVVFPEPGLNRIEFELPDTQSKMYVISMNNGKTVVAEKIALVNTF